VVTEYQIYKSWCSYCHKWQQAKVDLTTQVLGQGRFGVNVSSHLAYLRNVLRLPFRQIQACMYNLFKLKIAVGEIVEMLHRVSKQTAPQVEALKALAQASPVLHADETGWREDGQNGYIWALATSGPQAVRYYNDLTKPLQIVIIAVYV
jgi:hypothetical protein